MISQLMTQKKKITEKKKPHNQKNGWDIFKLITWKSLRAK